MTDTSAEAVIRCAECTCDEGGIFCNWIAHGDPQVNRIVDDYRAQSARIAELEKDVARLQDRLQRARGEALDASLFAAELAEGIGPSDEWSHDFKEGYIFGGRDAARMIRQKCTFPDAALQEKPE